MASNTAKVLIPPAAAPTNSAATLDIRPARPLVHIPSVWDWLGWVLAGLVLALVAAYAWRRFRRQQNALPPAVVIPPYRRALERLRAALELIHQPERFCVAVSDTVRIYLEERFDLHAPERTTEEFLAEIQSGSLLSDLQRALMSDFLTRCDLVKFARYEPAEPELRELHTAAMRLVEETEPLLNPRAPAAMPAPVPAEAAASAP